MFIAVQGCYLLLTWYLVGLLIGCSWQYPQKYSCRHLEFGILGIIHTETFGPNGELLLSKICLCVE